MDKMYILPVSPLLSPDGNLVSLSALRGTLNATPVPLDPGEVIGDFDIFSQEFSVSVAAKLGIGSIFSASVQSGETGFWMDAMQYAESGQRQFANNVVNDVVTQTRWGYGLRILCRAMQVDYSLNLDFSLLGAAADLGIASVSYEVQAIGLGPSALGAILGGVSQFGVLNSDTLHSLNTTVVQNLAKIIANPPAPLTPRPISVQLNIPVGLDPVVKAHSEVFAMRRLRDGMSLTSALARAAGNYDAAAIRGVYGGVEPGIGDDDTPSATAQQFAKQWMG
jgi:hypothetical protein